MESSGRMTRQRIMEIDLTMRCIGKARGDKMEIEKPIREGK
jgi:hypothetical protein